MTDAESTATNLFVGHDGSLPQALINHKRLELVQAEGVVPAAGFGLRGTRRGAQNEGKGETGKGLRFVRVD